MGVDRITDSAFKILKLQLGFLCPNCNSLVPVRGLFDKAAFCPTCNNGQNLSGKYGIAKLMYLGNPPQTAIDACLINKKKRAVSIGSNWIFMNQSRNARNASQKCGAPLKLSHQAQSVRCDYYGTFNTFESSFQDKKKFECPYFLLVITVI